MDEKPKSESKAKNPFDRKTKWSSDTTKHYKKTQADRIISKFGGASNMASILAEVDPTRTRNQTSILRWTYDRPKGCGGIIPSEVTPIILVAARKYGILLTPEDWFPGVWTKKNMDVSS